MFSFLIIVEKFEKYTKLTLKRSIFRKIKEEVNEIKAK